LFEGKIWCQSLNCELKHRNINELTHSSSFGSFENYEYLQIFESAKDLGEPVNSADPKGRAAD